MKKLVLFLAVAFAGTFAFAQGSWQKGLATKSGGDSLFYTSFSSIDTVIFDHYSNQNIVGNAGDFVWVDTGRTSFVTADRKVAFDQAYVAASTVSPEVDGNVPYYMRSKTPQNGYILFSPFDNSSVAGGKRKYGQYNAYAQIKKIIPTDSAKSVQVSFYQYILRSAEDKYYIEWSANGTTWDSLEINEYYYNDLTPGVVTSQGLYEKTVTLGASAANQEALYIRFRVVGNTSDSTETGAGYFWAIDDLKVSKGPENGLSCQRSYYSDNVYHQLPLGIKVPPITWYAYGINTGANTAKNVKVGLSTPYASKFTDNPIMIDTITPYNVDTIVLGKRQPYIISKATTGSISLDASREGTYYLVSKIQSDSVDLTIDSLPVKVNGGENNTKRIWARDNGQLSFGSVFAWMPLATGFFSYDPTVVTRRNSVICLAYELDSTQTDPVYINGIQLVPGTPSEGNPVISPVINLDDASNTEYTSNTNHFYDVTVSSSLLAKNYNSFLDKKSYYLDSLNTVDIPVRRSIKMKPGVKHNVCYRIPNANTKFYIGVDGVQPTASITNFGGLPISTQKPNFGPGLGTIIAGNPASSNTGENPRRLGLEISYTPMIRLMIGTTPDTTGIESYREKANFNMNAYPNPASEYMVVNYKLPVAANVSLEIFDITGRIVKSTNIGKQAAGYNQYRVDLSTFTKGTYFYSLKVNGMVETKKLMVVK